MISKINSFISKKLNRTNERSTNAVKNIIASFFVKGISIIISLFLVPLTINYVNSTQYGIWLTLSSVIAWFTFFDIGFSNGLRNKFAEAKAIGDNKKARAYISTTYVCLGIIFFLVWVLFFCINFFIDWSIILNAPEQMAKDLSLVAIIVFSFFCIQMVLMIINTIFIADQKPAKSAFFDMLGQILTLIFIFILTKVTSGSLIYLALVLGSSPILIMLISSCWFYNHEYKKYCPSIYLFEKKIVKEILSLGGKFFLVQIAAIIIYQTNNIIIAQICGPQNVTTYNISYKYFSVLNMIFMIIISPFWSAFTDAYTIKDTVWMKKIIKKLELTWIVLSGIALVMLLCSKLIYKLWIGNSVHVPFILSLSVCIYVLILMRFSIYIYLINGIGKIKLQLYFNMILCILNIPVAIFFGNIMGITGIVLGNILISLPHTIWSPIQLKRILNNEAKGIWNE